MTDKSLDISKELSIAWFQTHADQRLRLINFYIVLLVGTMAFIFAKDSFKSPIILMVIGGLLIGITIVFKLLDRRISQIIKVAEASLDKIEQQLEAKLGYSELRLIKNSESKKYDWSFRKSFNVLFGFGATIGLCSIVYGISTLC